MSCQVHVYGHSDDLIEVDGAIHCDLNEEFYANYDEPTTIRLSNGARMEMEYTKRGEWEIEPLEQPADGSIILREVGGRTAPNGYSEKAIIVSREHVHWAEKEGD